MENQNNEQSDGKYKSLFMASRDAIMTLEPPSWKFSSGNPATIELFKAKDEAEFIACEPWKLSPEFQPEGRPSMEKAKEMIFMALQEGSHSFEWIHRKLDGENFPAEVLLSRVEHDEKTFLLAVVRDITEQKRIQDLVGKVDKVLVEKELEIMELKKQLKEKEGL